MSTTTEPTIALNKVILLMGVKHLSLRRSPILAARPLKKGLPPLKVLASLAVS
jgi:hypothetical protein